MMDERVKLYKVLRDLVWDTGDAMPGWSILGGPLDYICSYCGAPVSKDIGGRILKDRHDETCPVWIAQQMIEAYDHEGNDG